MPDISCSHCVLQWTYTAGNNWGTCSNGTEAVGCGPQETFRACADIAIHQGHISQVPNEIPTTTSEENDQTPTPTTPDEYNKYDGFKTLIVVGVSLFVVLLLISIVYTYYYQVGGRIKGWLKLDTLKQRGDKGAVEVRGDEGAVEVRGKRIILPPPPKEPAPVPPPRGRRNSHANTDNCIRDESLA